MALTRLSQRSQVGLGFKAKGDLPAAIRHFEQAISYDPGYARGYNNLGNALQATAHMPHRSIRPPGASAHCLRSSDACCSRLRTLMPSAAALMPSASAHQ